MPPTLADRVIPILEAIERLNQALAGKSREDLAGNVMLRLAVERLLEIICEASRHIPNDAKARAPEIAWPKMVDFGNRLRHAYHRVEIEILWSIIENELPPLRAFVRRIVDEEKR